MINKTLEILNEGLKYVSPIMEENGFKWVGEKSGNGSGGAFSSGKFVKYNIIKDKRTLELHFRYSLGLVTYQIGNVKLSHEEYMNYAAGKNKSEYPGFSENPLDAFKDLANDLNNYAQDFLKGSGKEFKLAKEEAEKRNKLSGFQKLYH